IVLRISEHGGRGSADALDHVRGVVYDQYLRGRWLRAGSPAHRLYTVTRGPLSGPGVIELRRTDSEPPVLFLPLFFRQLATQSGQVYLDALGGSRRAEGDPGQVAWLQLYPDDKSALPPASPRAQDLYLPPEVAG